MENDPAVRERVQKQEKARAIRRLGRGGMSLRAESAFADALRAIHLEEDHADIEDLLSRLDQQAQVLAQSRQLPDLVRYRDLVQQLLQRVVEGGYAVSRHRTFDRRGRQRLFVLVNKVNSSLEELLQMVISRQASQLELLAKMGQIRGLLVDLYS